MFAKQPIAHPGRMLLVVVTLVAGAALGACGGSEDAVSEELTAQQKREAAALKRAHAINADAMGKIKHERAQGQPKNN